MRNTDLVARLTELIEMGTHMDSMGLEQITDEYVYRMWGGQVSMEEINEAFAGYYAKKIDEEMERLWDEGKINADVLEEWSKEHMRTPYR